MLSRRAVQQRGCLVFSFHCSGRTLLTCCLFDLKNSTDMRLHLFLLCSHFIALASMNSINPERTEEHVAEGGNIKLTCKYDGAIRNIQWYRQDQRSRPEFLLYITEGGSIHPTLSDFSAHINKTEKHVDLEIISAKVTDSAVYYCAVNLGGTKLLFGSGMTLFVQSKEEQEPSFYKLGEGDTEVCLATGFSRFNQLQNETIFNGTKPVRISVGEEGEGENSVFTQVAYMTPGNNNSCTEEESKTECAETLEPDPMVNLMSLTTIGLRILFIKTIIFNVLMTLRLWISQ